MLVINIWETYRDQCIDGWKVLHPSASFTPFYLFAWQNFSLIHACKIFWEFMWFFSFLSLGKLQQSNTNLYAQLFLKHCKESAFWHMICLTSQSVARVFRFAEIDSVIKIMANFASRRNRKNMADHNGDISKKVPWF